MYGWLWCAVVLCVVCFCLKRKTAYDRGSNDWSSGVGSSDLAAANAADSARPVDGGRGLPILVALLMGGDEMLAPVLDPFDRAAERHRDRRNEDVLGIGLHLRPEAAADVRSDDAHLVRRQLHHLGENL